MPNIKVVRKLVMANLMEFRIVQGVPDKGLQTEPIDVSDLSNEDRMEKVPRWQLEETDVEFLAEYDGTLAPVRQTGTVEITYTKNDGSTVQKDVVGFVLSAIPQSVDIGGERRLLQRIMFTPDGSAGTSTTTVAP